MSGDSDADLPRFDGEPSGIGPTASDLHERAQGVDPEHHDAEVEASEPETSGAGDAAAAGPAGSVDDTSAPEGPDA